MTNNKRFALIAAIFLVILVPITTLRTRLNVQMPINSEDLDQPRLFVRREFNDNILDYTKVTYDTGVLDPRPSVLVMALIGTAKSYGGGRTFGDFYETIRSQFSEDYTYLLAFLFGTEEEFEEVDEILPMVVEVTKVTKVTLIYAPFLDKDLGFDRGMRHAHKVQRLRRRNIARCRNFLMFNALEDQRYTLFMDADVVSFDSPQTLDIFIKSGQDIIVPRITWGGAQDYDRNTWRGHRVEPSEDQLKEMDEGNWDNWIPHDSDNMWHFHNFVVNTNHEQDGRENDLRYHVPLDSVGGAVLFAKAIVYKQGAVYPTSYIVGTDWLRKEGWDGIETEGLCYLAKPLGFKCWGYPNLVANHDTT